MASLSIVWRGLGFVAAWWVLTGGASTSWTVGGPVIALALWLTVIWPSRRPNRIRPLALVSFLPFFLVHSLRGGLDVAWRACLPGLPISPGMIDFPLRLPEHDSSRIFFVNSLNLLPGTLTVDLAQDSLRIHLLTQGPEVVARLVELEDHVARLFGHHLGGWSMARIES
jgi:multicomponent Na+:H+ antiporter subunit E